MQTPGDSGGHRSLTCCSQSMRSQRVSHDLVAEQQPPLLIIRLDYMRSLWENMNIKERRTQNIGHGSTPTFEELMEKEEPAVGIK